MSNEWWVCPERVVDRMNKYFQGHFDYSKRILLDGIRKYDILQNCQEAARKERVGTLDLTHTLLEEDVDLGLINETAKLILSAPLLLKPDFAHLGVPELKFSWLRPAKIYVQANADLMSTGAYGRPHITLDQFLPFRFWSGRQEREDAALTEIFPTAYFFNEAFAKENLLQ